MKMAILACVCALVIAGCATDEVIWRDRPVEVLVPVPVPAPEAPEIKEPFLPIWLLEGQSIGQPELIAKAYVKSIIILQEYANTLQCALDAYRETTQKMCRVDPEEIGAK